jgi:digeranylgeranylglycerophospholipid reductase
MHDVAIIGAGPGGLHAARRLAARGLDVVVLEEHSRIGAPVHCTGILSADAFSQFNLPANAVLNQLRTAKFFSPSGQTFDYSTERVEAVVVDRLVFDQALKTEAVQAGATIRGDSRVSAIETAAGGVRLSLSGVEQPLLARSCILACGASYALQRNLGLGTPPAFLQSAQLEVPAAVTAKHVEIHFGCETAPKGFAWVVPVPRGTENFVRIGLMCEGSNAAALFRRFAERIAGRWGVAAENLGEPRRKMLPLAPIHRTYGNRVLVVGDAAGLVKPTTGGGIYYSVLTADLAVAVLAQALDRDELHADALSRYEREWRTRFGFELKVQLAFRNHGQRLTDGDIEELFDLVRTDGIMPLLKKTADFNQHRALILALLRHKQFRSIFLRTLQSAG